MLMEPSPGGRTAAYAKAAAPSALSRLTRHIGSERPTLTEGRKEDRQPGNEGDPQQYEPTVETQESLITPL